MNTLRKIVATALAAAVLMSTAAAADAAWGSRSSGYNPSKVRSNYPGWERSYPRGSVRQYGNLPFYMRADRRPLGLTP